MLLERYRPALAGMSSDAVTLLSSRLGLPETPATGEGLWEVCREAGLDAADLVCAVAGDASALAHDVLERLAGRRIERLPPGIRTTCPVTGRPIPQEQSELPLTAPPPPTRRATRADPRVVLAVAPNPKRPGSAAHARYSAWRTGATVDECLAAGLTAEDVRWDTRRGYVTLGGPA